MLANISSPDSVFRHVMRKLASSVVVITANNGAQRNGLTATAMCSLSTDPQSIVVCVNKFASAAELILQSRCFAVSILRDDQEEIAKLFSTAKMAAEQRFSGGYWHKLISGAPILADALACLDCEVAAHHTFSTHHIFVGRILAIQSQDGRGLIYCNGQYRRLEGAA